MSDLKAAEIFYKKYLKLGMTDPDVFVRKIVSPTTWRNPLTGNIEEMHPNAPQLRWLKGSWMPYNVWAAGNSSGKTFGEALKACWWANYKFKPIYQPDGTVTFRVYSSYDEYRAQPYKILLTGPETKQAMALFETAEHLLTNSTYLDQKVVNITMGTKRDPHARIELSNGVSIHAASTKNKGRHIESGDFDLIGFDEPEDEPHLEYVIDKVLVPRMFRRGGVLDLIGTPKDSPQYLDWYRRGAPVGDDFYDERYVDHKNYWSMNSSSFENPFASQETIEKFSNTKDEKVIQERLYGKFVSFTNSAFPEEAVHLCLDPELPVAMEPSHGRIYVTGVDFGRKNDFTVAVTLDVTEVPYTMVHFGRWGGGAVSWEFIFNQLYSIFSTYQSEFFVDATSSGGDMQVEYLRELGVFYKQFIYSPAKKVILINNLQDIMARGKVKFGYVPELREELRFYPRDLNDKNFDTDCVMALALACLRAKDFNEHGEPYEY